MTPAKHSSMPNFPTDILRHFFEHPCVKQLMTGELLRFEKKVNALFDVRYPESMSPNFQEPVSKSTWLEFGREGLLGLSVPIELGGKGLGQVAAFVLSAAAARSLDVGLSLGFHVHNDVAMGWLLATQQSNARTTFLPEMISGRLIGCTCFTEHGDSPMTTAERHAGNLIVNGHKAFAINGVNADLCFVTAELEGKLCTILVEKDTSGVNIVKKHDKLGAQSIDQADIRFTNVVVSEDRIVSKPGLQQLLHWNDVMTTARAHVAFDAFLLMAILFDHIHSYSSKRVVGGKLLGTWPVHQQVIADAHANLELIKSNLINFLIQKTNSAKFNLVEEMAALKHFAIEKAFGFSLACCDMEGGRGYMNDSVSLQIFKQIMALRYSTGSQYKTKEIASAYHRENHKRDASSFISENVYYKH